MRMTLWPSSSVGLKFEMYPSSFRMRAISSFSREAGTSTFWCRAWSAFRTRVSMSATGSVNLIVSFSFSRSLACAPCSQLELKNLRRLARLAPQGRKPLIDQGIPNGAAEAAPFQNHHHEDFETPGISPRSASWRKHKRQMPNLRRKARGRPHSLQRLCLRVENLGFLASFTRFAVVAKLSS